jgi:hypothetical protein
MGLFHIFDETHKFHARKNPARKDNEERPPSIWKSYVTPFIGGHATFEGQGHENWRKHFNMNVEPRLTCEDCVVCVACCVR